MLALSYTISDQYSLAIVETSQGDVEAFQSNGWSLCCKCIDWTKWPNTTSCTRNHTNMF